MCLFSSDALQFVEHMLGFVSSLYPHHLTYAVKVDFLIIIASLEFQVLYEDYELAGIIRNRDKGPTATKQEYFTFNMHTFQHSFSRH